MPFLCVYMCVHILSIDACAARGVFAPEEDSSESAQLPRCIRVLPHHNDTGGSDAWVQVV